jgi:hypothetical protein
MMIRPQIRERYVPFFLAGIAVAVVVLAILVMLVAVAISNLVTANSGTAITTSTSTVVMPHLAAVPYWRDPESPKWSRWLQESEVAVVPVSAEREVIPYWRDPESPKWSRWLQEN